MNKVLIVIDAQEDFTRGALKNDIATSKLPLIHEIVVYANDYFDNPIIYTADTHDEDYLITQEGKNLPICHCINGTPGHKLCPEVKLPIRYYKLSPELAIKSTFGYRDWGFYNLDHVKEIWLCGFCTDICVMANFQLLKMIYPEIPITIITDACAGVTTELHEAALKVMESCQANLKTWNELKDEQTIICPACNHPHCKVADEEECDNCKYNKHQIEHLTH